MNTGNSEIIHQVRKCSEQSKSTQQQTYTNMILKLKLINTFKLFIQAEMSNAFLSSGTLVFVKAPARGECFAPSRLKCLKYFCYPAPQFLLKRQLEESASHHKHASHMTGMSGAERVSRRYAVRIRPMESVAWAKFRQVFELCSKQYRICIHFVPTQNTS